MLRALLFAGAVALVTAYLVFPCNAGEFEPPVKLTGVDGPIDVQRSGHSAPFVGDFDGDGVNDLLVGEFHEGRLRVLRNMGSNDAPRYDRHQSFKAGADFGRVPSG